MNENHLADCLDHECAAGCPVQAARDAEYRSGHEWHENEDRERQSIDYGGEG